MHSDIEELGWQGRENLLGSFSYGGGCSLTTGCRQVYFMNEKLITALLAILLALGGWTLQRTFSLSQDMVLIKTKVEIIEDEVQSFKNLKGKKKRKRKKEARQTRWMKYLVSSLIITLLWLATCSQVFSKNEYLGQNWRDCHAGEITPWVESRQG